jgi:hypothetical protein
MGKKSGSGSRVRICNTAIFFKIFFQLFSSKLSLTVLRIGDPGSGAFLTPGSGMGKKSGSGSGVWIRNTAIFFLFFFQLFSTKLSLTVLRIRDPGSGVSATLLQYFLFFLTCIFVGVAICSLNGRIHLDPNLLPRLLLPPHHIQVHALLLLVALVVPLIVWIPAVIIIIVIIIIIILQLVRNLVDGEPLGLSLSCPETKKIFLNTNYMILLTVSCVLRI